MGVLGIEPGYFSGPPALLSSRTSIVRIMQWLLVPATVPQHLIVGHGQNPFRVWIQHSGPRLIVTFGCPVQMVCMDISVRCGNSSPTRAAENPGHGQGGGSKREGTAPPTVLWQPSTLCTGGVCRAGDSGFDAIMMTPSPECSEELVRPLLTVRVFALAWTGCAL